MPDPAKTEYVILAERRNGSEVPVTWVACGTTPASSAHAAIRWALEQTPPPVGERFVAIPTRSFKPVKPTKKTTVTVSFEDA